MIDNDNNNNEYTTIKSFTVERSKVAVLNSIDNNTGASGMENDMIDGESGAIVVYHSRRKI